QTMQIKCARRSQSLGTALFAGTSAIGEVQVAPHHTKAVVRQWNPSVVNGCAPRMKFLVVESYLTFTA
ncbi:MAG TPA: hypothetical protein VF961_11760, partial [Pyrinomonadaceae bacterium]